MTKVHTAFPAADTFFPNLDQDPAWQVTETEGPYVWGALAYTYYTYERTADQPQQ